MKKETSKFGGTHMCLGIEGTSIDDFKILFDIHVLSNFW